MLKRILVILTFFLIMQSQLQGQTCNGNYLSAQGNKLFDSNGKEVRLTGVNWFGFETSMLYPHGIWSRDCKSMLKQIKDQGFNCIRIPWCNKVLDPAARIQINSYGTDPYTGVSPMNAAEATKTKPVEILDIIVQWCQENNMKIILDNHSRKPDGYMEESLWYTAEVSDSKWISDWVLLATRYKNFDAVVAMDLDNEPHGKSAGGATWGNSNPATDWNKAAERCGNAILQVNPNVLIMVEGVEMYNGIGYWWGGNLIGAKDYPVVLSNPKKLVYSPHEYGPTVWPQEWFTSSEFPGNMPGIWEKYFNYLITQNIAPLFVGEFGIRDAGGKDEVWFDTFIKFMGNKYSWTFWCWNPNSGDTGGLLDDQWRNVVTWKVNKLKPYLAPVITNCSGNVPQNIPPIALATATPTSGQAPLNVNFSATGSTDSDGAIIMYSWNFGDGTSGTGSTILHNYSTSGNYAAILTVTDDKGATSQSTVNIIVGGISIPVTGVIVSPVSASISVNGTTSLTATVAPANATNKSVNWSSGNTAIATVSTAGVVTGKAEGTAIITATTVDQAKTAIATITVTSTKVSVTGVTVSPVSTTISVNGTTSLIATIAPANATNKSVNWSSGNTAIATVSAAGVVTGKAAGSAIITATTVDQGKTARATITVISTKVPVTGVSVSPTSNSVNVGSTVALTATVAPANATDKTVTWSSGSTAIATVSSTGVVTGLAEGSAIITATASGFTATSVITVTSRSVCSNPIAISIPFSQNGAGDYCWSTTKAIAYVNSWNTTLVEINGVNFTNTWSNNLPAAAADGKWYIHYIGQYAWSHFEAPALKNAEDLSFIRTGIGINVYPNPANNIVIIESNALINELTIISMNGRTVFSKSVDNNTISIEIAELMQGLYILRIQTENETVFKQLIIN